MREPNRTTFRRFGALLRACGDEARSRLPRQNPHRHPRRGRSQKLKVKLAAPTLVLQGCGYNRDRMHTAPIPTRTVPLGADYAGRRATAPEPEGKMPMPLPHQSVGDERLCPLCRQPNACGAASARCWCFDVVVPPALLARVPQAQRGRACICRNCIAAYAQKDAAGPRPAPSPGPNRQ